ncbi:TPA: zinc metalloprotease HtpX [Candidatus Woesearchaeota archaeon]|nr:Protease HtpX-like protein [archaeon GW2011_AR15]MBS3104153.1 zinc metalloprotease HtpX [Candidatus Woesearchaeota archaeon]HIH41433.1 zinc metalloprotease HtpX [Candidatus Woesearchaeota archaeon]
MINQIKTVMLLGLLTALLLWVGQLVGGASGLTAAFVIVLLMNFIMYWFSDKIVLAMYRAKPAHKNSELYALVKETSKEAGLPMPKVYMIPSNNPNAFATGRNPKNSAVACTDGILNLLSKEELKGVIAHELSHIKNRDTLITTIAATIAGVIAYVAAMARWAAIFGGFGGRDRDDNNIISLLVLAVLTPLIATIIQLAISRQREYIADATAAKITKKPVHLADALIKIEQGIKLHPMAMGSEATSSLFIANPFRGAGLLNLFSTHPPIKERVARLKAMKIQ